MIGEGADSAGKSAGLLAAAALAAYWGSLSGPLIFDDIAAIVENPSIRSLSSALVETTEVDTATAVGRPLLRVSLWANYAWAGLDVRWFHAVNILLHVLAAWTLFGLCRRLLGGPKEGARFGQASSKLAFVIALLWTVHPLQTESVTYTVQRAEILGGLFYLLTLYCVARSASAGGRSAAGWSAGAVASCFAGMASKETLATAPLVALAMDRIFLAASWEEIRRKRKWLYAALAATWIFQAVLVRASSGRLGTVGFGLEIAWWEYALTQPYFLCRYLALSVYPDPLILDYGEYIGRSAGEIVPYLFVVLGLVSATVAALRKWPAAGFCGLWFFLILAPTSSIVPVVSQTGAEHRMYLPLAGVVGLAVAGVHAALQRIGDRTGAPSRVVLPLLVAAAAAALSVRTFARNLDYRSDIAIWEATLESRPDNPRASNNLGKALEDAGEPLKAARHYMRALQIDPRYPEAHVNLGNALAKLRRPAEAIRHYEAAIALRPTYVYALNNLAWLLATDPEPGNRNGRRALKLAERAATLTKGRNPNALDTLAVAQAEAGQFGLAQASAGQALALARRRQSPELAAEIEARLSLFRSGQPYRSPALSSFPPARP